MATQPSKKALVSLDDWTDDLAEPVPFMHMNHVCKHCGSRNFAGERVNQGQTGTSRQHFNICCRNGKTASLPQWPAPPPEFKDLLQARGQRGKELREHIRHYNNGLAMVSVGAVLKTPPGTGPPVFRVQGQIVHRAGDLRATEGTQPAFAQLYLYDPDTALEARMATHTETTRATMRALQDLMYVHNPYVQSYKHLKEVHEEAEEEARAHGTEVVEYGLSFENPKRADERRYNKPRTREVAMVFTSPDGMPPNNRDIVQFMRNGPTRRVSEHNGNVDPMAYPLLLWGEHAKNFGWHLGMEHAED